jgi:hypothetical protein
MAESWSNAIPSMLDLKTAGRFWLAIVLTGLGTGTSAAVPDGMAGDAERSDLRHSSLRSFRPPIWRWRD